MQVAINRDSITSEIDVAIKSHTRHSMHSDRGDAVIPARPPSEVRHLVSGIETLISAAEIDVLVNAHIVVAPPSIITIVGIIAIDRNVPAVTVNNRRLARRRWRRRDRKSVV